MPPEGVQWHRIAGYLSKPASFQSAPRCFNPLPVHAGGDTAHCMRCYSDSNTRALP